MQADTTTSLELDSTELEDSTLELDSTELEDSTLELDSTELEDSTLELDSTELEDSTLELDSTELEDSTLELDSTELEDSGSSRFVAARGFGPPPLIRSPVADVVRNTAFCNTLRIHGVANAISHFIKTFVVAMLVVVAVAVHELDALGNDNFARARFDRAGGFHAGAGFNRT